MLLHPRGVGVPDWPPPLRFALSDLAVVARIFLPFIETLMPDEEAWEAQFTDEQRLAIAKSVWGKRLKPKKTTSQGELW